MRLWVSGSAFGRCRIPKPYLLLSSGRLNSNFEMKSALVCLDCRVDRMQQNCYTVCITYAIHAEKGRPWMPFDFTKDRWQNVSGD